MTETTKISGKIRITNKIHTAVTDGKVGSIRDTAGRKAKASCGQISARVNAYYVADSSAVTCKKCLTD